MQMINLWRVCHERINSFITYIIITFCLLPHQDADSRYYCALSRELLFVPLFGFYKTTQNVIAV